MPEPDKDLILAQAKLGKSLALGFVLSLYPMFGIVTFIIGIRASRTIKASQGKLKWQRMTYWCLIVGLLETIACLLAMLYGMLGLYANR